MSFRPMREEATGYSGSILMMIGCIIPIFRLSIRFQSISDGLVSLPLCAGEQALCASAMDVIEAAFCLAEC